MDDVVGVKDDKGVVVRGAQAFKGLAKHVALGSHVLANGQDAGAAGAGDLLGAVGAVVGQHVDVEAVAGIVLRQKGVDQRADDGLLIAGRAQDA